MRTSLTELLDVDLSFSEIQQQLEDETEDFTVNEGEVWFDRQFEAGVAEGILKLHYGDVENLGIDTADNGEKSLYKIVYSDLIVDDYNFPDETVEESLNEEVSYSKNLKDKINEDFGEFLDEDIGFKFSNPKILLAILTKQKHKIKS